MENLRQSLEIPDRFDRGHSSIVKAAGCSIGETLH